MLPTHHLLTFLLTVYVIIGGAMLVGLGFALAVTSRKS